MSKPGPIQTRALALTCTFCGAGPGASCVGKRGKVITSIHVPRLQAAHNPKGSPMSEDTRDTAGLTASEVERTGGAIGSSAPTVSPFDADRIKAALLAAPIDPRLLPEDAARALIKAFAVVDASISPAASGS